MPLAVEGRMLGSHEDPRTKCTGIKSTSLAEEFDLAYGGSECEEARATSLRPTKSLYAELALIRTGVVLTCGSTFNCKLCPRVTKIL